ncbi:11604_t:CDS:1 [Acaulospora morrowiae]|uniref:11604_t:CDS:1 n=1 Tax=Acaulospora morrowiae TaxID=94023 RepID=A0A9N9C7S9_9GLOM|nr:11604_t:CDS:1 [Acaulospora morrowiae]
MPHDKRPSNKPVLAEASGNTFLIFDYLDKEEHNFDENIIRYYHRLYGFEKIDSCLVLTKAKEQFDSAQVGNPDSTLFMRMYVYEPGDGFCGNGARVVAKYCFSHYNNIWSRFFIVLDGQLHELLQRGNEYSVEMGKSVYEDLTGDFVKKGALDTNGKLILDGITWYYVNTSEPHLVTFDEIDDKKLINIGDSLNQDMDQFRIGINLNRVSILGKSAINALTFERGINRLTKACGSGSTSCVALAKRLRLIDDAKKVVVKVRGGYVVVTNEENKIYLSGPCWVDGIDSIEIHPESKI